MNVWTNTLRLIPGLLLILSGCVTATVPSIHNTSAVAAVRAADEVGAERNPRAALHLRLAREELLMARNLVRDEEAERATLMFRRSQMDAELALAITREAAATQQHREARERLSAMRSGTR